MTLSTELNYKIVEFLTSIPNIDNIHGQRALLIYSGLDSQLLSQIPFGGPPGQFFQLLVPTLVSYGTLENGRDPLVAVLEAAKTYVGLDKRDYCDQLIQELHGFHEKTEMLAEPSFKASLYNLPVTAPELFGREEELNILDETWNNSQINILSLVALGGIGKTALVNDWLDHLAKDNFRGAKQVYGWSFYSQGIQENSAVSSADRFFYQALEWFGDSDPMAGSPWERGIRLAELIRKDRCLIILDGLEQQQYPSGKLQGQLKDVGLQALLKGLCRSNSGLCVITTRIAIKDLEYMKDESVKQIFLAPLSPKAGAELLRKSGVKGTLSELQTASEEFKGHALTLSLLGSYLDTVHDGDIRKRTLTSDLTKDEYVGGHARRVMQSYESWLQDKPELTIMYLMGLFDRPAPKGAIDTLRIDPPIEGLTVKLQNISTAKWEGAVERLRTLRLLVKKDKHAPDTLDCRPLVREYFSERLRTEHPDARKEGHRRLYDYYKNLPDKEYPDTLVGLEPLFVAVSHGCQAGLYLNVWEEVYWKRINRGDERYSMNQLGAFGANLSALSNFFREPWIQLKEGLSKHIQISVLNLARSALVAVGRMQEAVNPMQMELDLHIKQTDWENAAIVADDLRELWLTLNNLQKAVDYAQQSVTFADKIEDSIQKTTRQFALADLLHQTGNYSEAEHIFRKAKQILRKHRVEYSFLQEFRFCDLLLSQGQYQEVEQRSNRMSEELAKQTGFMVALDKLLLSWTLLLKVQEEFCEFNQTEAYLNQAIASSQEAGMFNYLLRGLLLRAALYRLQGQFSKAEDDLEEVQAIAERNNIMMHLADHHVERARLLMAQSEYGEAQVYLKKAKNLVMEIGYHRLDKELSMLETINSHRESFQDDDVEVQKNVVNILGTLNVSEGVHILIENWLLRENQQIKDTIIEALQNISKRDLNSTIESVLLEKASISTEELPDIPMNAKISSLLIYHYAHPELDLEYVESSQVLSFRKLSIIRDFKRLWNNAERLLGNDIQAFSQSVSQVSQKFCSSLGLSLIGRNHFGLEVYEKLSISHLDVSPILPNLPSNNILIFFFQSERLLDDDFEELEHWLEHILSYSRCRIAFLILFIEPFQMEEVRKLINQRIHKVFGYVVLLFTYKRLISIVGAKYPQQILRDILLAEIDLHSISPFTTDGAASGNMFFGREKELWDISDHANTNSFALIGGRKIGKTSILRRLEQVRLPEANFQPYYFTCERMDQQEPAKLDFLQAIGNVWFPQKKTVSWKSFADVLNYLPKSKPLVFLIDEVDRLIGTDCRNGWPLFRELRALSEEKLCQFVFAGEKILREAVQDSTGRLYNFPKVKKIGFLNFENVKELVIQPLKTMNIELVEEEDIVQKIWAFTMGHPSIVQKICERLIENLDLKRERKIVPGDVENIIANPQIQHDDFLMIFWSHATILERILSLVISQQKSESYSSKEIRGILQDRLNLSPKVREINEALHRLVELRSILKKTPQGYYTFFVKAFPDVIAKTITAEDMLEELVEAYQERGDVIESTITVNREEL